MGKEDITDLTDLFLRLQGELEPVGVGEQTSLEAQLNIIESDLLPHFTSADRLIECLGCGGLTYEHAFLKKTRKWSYPRLLRFLDEYRAAQRSNEAALFAELAKFLPRMDSAYRHIVSICELEADKATLSGYAFARSCLRDMGDIIESTLYPFLCLRLEVLKILGTTKQARCAYTLSLGTLVNELAKIDPDMYSVPPFGISLSQWRNISHHSSYQIENDVVVCRYRVGSVLREVKCTRDQLIDIFINVEKIYYLHKVAFEFFCTDNIHALKTEQSATNAPDIELSEFSKQSTLAYGIVASGFRIVHAAKQGSRWHFILIDRHDRLKEQCRRALQASILPYLFQAGPTQMTVRVDTQGSQHFINFRGELRLEPCTLSVDEYSPFKISRFLRID